MGIGRAENGLGLFKWASPMTEESGVKEFELKRLIKTRWMATRARAINSIFEHWRPIVLALSEIRKDRSFEVEQRVKASVAYEMLAKAGFPYQDHR